MGSREVGRSPHFPNYVLGPVWRELLVAQSGPCPQKAVEWRDHYWSGVYSEEVTRSMDLHWSGAYSQEAAKSTGPHWFGVYPEAANLK